MTPTAASSCQQTLESARAVSPRALSFQQQEEEGDKGEGDKEGRFSVVAKLTSTSIACSSGGVGGTAASGSSPLRARALSRK